MCIHDEQEESPDAPAFSKIRLPAPVATINRLVVVPSARKFGLAKQLDERRIFAAKNGGAKCVVGTAAPARIAALERLGFRLTGDLWIQPYCESLAMHGMVLML
jgi:GNAT superfamily N-acetyltransferase